MTKEYAEGSEEVNDDTLETIRESLAALDAEILKIFRDRRQIAEKVWDIKKDTNKAVYDPDQEETKIKRLMDRYPEEDRQQVDALFRTLFRISREIQYAKAYADTPEWELGGVIRRAMTQSTEFHTIACQGSVGSYSTRAADCLYPDAAKIHIRTFAGVVQQVVDGNVDAGILPLENTTAGSVEDVYHLIEANKLHIVDTVDLSIRHHLVAMPDATLSSIRRVISHPQALAQCTSVIRGMDWHTDAVANTAFAAQEVARAKDKGLAAIASEKAAKSNGLKILMSEISNYYVNRTRFALVTKQPIIRSDADHVSLILHLPHQAGSLSRALGVFSDLGVNLTKIQSRPIPDRPWEYRFYLDFVGSPGDDKVMRLLYQMEKEIPDLQFIGWYRENACRHADESEEDEA